MLTLVILLAIASFASAQLSGRVGPKTTHQTKTAHKVCNINSYGARPGRTFDIGPALNAAFVACKTGGTILIPPGDWGLSTWVNFNGGSGFAVQWDGVIYRIGEGGGNMILVNHSDDVEIFSSNGRGAFQGNGYQFHERGNGRGLAY
jgi:rhamnogalacturonan hydrolase